MITLECDAKKRKCITILFQFPDFNMIILVATMRIMNYFWAMNRQKKTTTSKEKKFDPYGINEEIQIR